MGLGLFNRTPILLYFHQLDRDHKENKTVKRLIVDSPHLIGANGTIINWANHCEDPLIVY